MSDLWYRVLFLLVIAVVIWYGLRLYHIRRMAEVETAELELAGWVKIILPKVKFAWLCPHCGFPGVTSEAVHAHQDPAGSPCALLQLQREQEALRGDDDGRADMTATVVGSAREDPWPALGAEDAPAEVEA